MRRVLTYLAGAFLSILLLAVGALALVLGTGAGSRWALGQVPGLQVEDFQGRLGGQWRAASLLWQQGEERVAVSRPVFAWAPVCLLRLTLCIDRLEAERVDLAFATAQDGETQPLSLPELGLPLDVELGEVRVDLLTLDGHEQLREARLVAHWAAAGLVIDALALRRDDVELSLQGRLQPTGDWPLALQGQLRLPAPGREAWQVALGVEGDLQGTLQVKATSSGYLEATLDAQVQALAAHLPATATLRSEGFKAHAELPDTLRLEALQLSASGDLDNGYRLQGSARLPAEGEPVGVLLQGLVSATGATLDKLELNGEGEQRVSLAGRLDWQQALSAEGRLDWREFPWQRLYPEAQEPPVALKRLQAEAHYENGNYLGHFDAALTGPAGDFALASPVSGDLGQVSLPQVSLQAGQGRAQGQVNIGFADGISWRTALQLSELDPAYWLAELPGHLAGPLNSQGAFKDGHLRLQADIDLSGRLRGQAASLRANTSGEGAQWSLGLLEARLGDNRVHGSGQWQQRLDGNLSIAAPRLGQLWPGLQGALNGTLGLGGTPQAPQGRLQLTGQRFAFGDQRLDRLQLEATLDNAQRALIQLDANGLALGETALGRLQASGRGDRRQQSLSLNLQGPLVQASLALDGTLDDAGDWRGRLARGEVRSGGQDWRLQQVAPLQRLASGRVELGAHCWRSGQASLCGENQRLAPEPRIRYRLANFPLDGLGQWLPKDFAWRGQLDAEVSLDMPAAGPSGFVTLDAGAGSWRVREAQQWLDFTYDSLRLHTRLTPQRIDSDLQIRGSQIGELLVQAQLDPRQRDKPLQGHFRLSGLNLAMARPFVPEVEHLAGRLDGGGTLGGTLLRPDIDGNLLLSGGEASGGELPTRVEALQLRARIAGERVTLEGAWRGGDNGSGKLDGELAWRDEVRGQLRVSGTRLPIDVEPYAHLEVEPDLHLRLGGGSLSLDGLVNIPRGAIVVRELPPSTVKVSPDARIVGQQREQEQQGLNLDMNVRVEVGQDRLTFDGFGLNAELAGRLQVGNDLDTRGELDLNKGRFRAYGQRLTIRRARLLFAGPIDQPFLDVEAIRTVNEVVAGLRLTGNAEQPTTEVFSEPAMSQEQALSYLVLGRPLSQDAGDNNMLAQAALALGVAGSSGVTGSVAERLGINNFQLDTEGSGTTASVVASGDLSERLSLRYGVGVFEPVNTVALRYQLTRRLYLEAASGLASSLDLFYNRDF